MMGGGCVILLEGATFDAEETLAAIDKHKPQTLVIVGDSFGKPILNALNANPGKYDVSSVLAIVSSGVMWSVEVKRGMLEHMPQAMLSDGFSSSEALGMGQSMMAKGAEIQTAKFVLGERCRNSTRTTTWSSRARASPGIAAIGPAQSGRLLQGRGEDRHAPSAPSAACVTQSPATGAWWKPTARSPSWAAATPASTPPARRCFRKRSRRP